MDNFMEVNLISIRNKTSFFFGILRRYRPRVDKRQSIRAFMGLSPALQSALSPLFAKEKIYQGELNAICFTSLRGLDHGMVLQIVAIFMQANMSKIQNKTGFFMSII